MMRFYLEVARAAYRRQLVYRWANLAGLLTNIFFGALFSYVFIALYQARNEAAGYNLRDALRYIWLVQSLIMVVLRFSWYDLMLTIRSGEVVSDLSKPCDFYWYWFSREAGCSAYYLLFRGIPTYAAGALLFGFGVAGGWQAWLAFAASLVFATGLGIAYRFIYNVLAFWVLEARAVGSMASVIALFFAGSYVPVRFFPPLIRSTVVWLPFNGLLNVPAEMLVGRIDAPTLGLELFRQIAWMLLLTLIARGLSAAGARRVVAQGG